MDTYEITVEMSKGGYTGKLARNTKGYVARITGTDEQYGLRREFAKGKPDSNEPYRKSRCTWTDIYHVGEGLYEISEGGEKYLWIVFVRDGALKHSNVTPERARKIAEMLDAGETFESARLATRPRA